MDSSWLDRFVAAWRHHAQAGGPSGDEAAGRILEFFDVDGAWEDVAAQASYRGYRELQAMFEQSYQWCPTLIFDVIRARAGDGFYVIEWEMQGEGNGAFGDLAATDKPFKVRGVSVGEMTGGGKVTVHRDYWDRLGWMSQVGLSTSDIVQTTLEAAGLEVTPEELELLTAARGSMRLRAASLSVPEAQAFEPADVFSARDQT
jgi:hypothetical protein